MSSDGLPLLPGPPMGTQTLPKHFRASADAPPVLAGASYDELYINKRFDAQYADASLQHHLNVLRRPDHGAVFNADLVPPAELRDVEAEKKMQFRKSILKRFPVLKELVHPDFTKGVDTKALSLVGKKSMTASALEELLKSTTTPAAVAAAAEHRSPEAQRAFSHTIMVRFDVSCYLILCATSLKILLASFFIQNSYQSVQKPRIAKVGMANPSPVKSPPPFRLVNKQEARDALKDKPLETPFDNPYMERPSFGRDPFHGKPFVPASRSESKAKLENCAYLTGSFFPELGSDTTPMTLHLQEHLSNIRYSSAAPPYVFPADMPVFHPNRASFHATVARKQLEDEEKQHPQHTDTASPPASAGATTSADDAPTPAAARTLSASASSASIGMLSASSSTASLLPKDASVRVLSKDDFTHGQTKGTWQRPYFKPAAGEPAHPNALEATGGVKGRPSRRTLGASSSTATLGGTHDFDMFVPTLSKSATAPSLRVEQWVSSAAALSKTSSTRSLIADPDAAAPVAVGSVGALVPWPKEQAPRLYTPLPLTGARALPADAATPQPWQPYKAPPPPKVQSTMRMLKFNYLSYALTLLFFAFHSLIVSRTGRQGGHDRRRPPVPPPPPQREAAQVVPGGQDAPFGLGASAQRALARRVRAHGRGRPHGTQRGAFFFNGVLSAQRVTRFPI